MRFTAALLALALPTATLASGATTSLGKGPEIRSLLSAQGFEVTEIDYEDGYFEAEAIRGGIEYDIYLTEDLEILLVKED